MQNKKMQYVRLSLYYNIKNRDGQRKIEQMIEKQEKNYSNTSYQKYKDQRWRKKNKKMIEKQEKKLQQHFLPENTKENQNLGD